MNYNWPQIAAAVYQACIGYDQYLPKLDADVARAWGRVFAFYGLSTEDLLAGVDKLYREKVSGFRPLPGDIAAAARGIREDRLARLPLPELDAHYERVMERIAPKVIELPEARPANVQIRYRRPKINPMLVPCSHCHAPEGRACRAGASALMQGTRFHPSRSDAASVSVGSTS
jgi:hypothetical protein